MVLPVYRPSLLVLLELGLIVALEYRPPGSAATLHNHDEKFKPDKILRISQENFSMDCTTRWSVLVNGSIPGPTLAFTEGERLWIRVYNDMHYHNVTIVILSRRCPCSRPRLRKVRFRIVGRLRLPAVPRYEIELFVPNAVGGERTQETFPTCEWTKAPRVPLVTVSVKPDSAEKLPYERTLDLSFQHWHGLTQRMSPFSDGTPLASQWPIPPLHYFDYEFRLFPGDAGTYFYHSHAGFGAVTAFGPLVVNAARPSKGPFQYDEERILIISDVFHPNDSYIEEGLLANPFRWSGETDNIMLNGKARSPFAKANQSGPSCSYDVITVKPGKTYRFRIIGATALSQVFMGFELHNEIQLIEVDGHYVEPVKIEHLEVHSGQRYSILIKTKNAEQIRRDRESGKHSYWIQMETRTRALVTTAYGLLAYDLPEQKQAARKFIDTFTFPGKTPLKLPKESLADSGWLEGDLSRLNKDNEDYPKLSEVTRRVVVDVQQIYKGSISWVQNHYPWFENTPHEPYLVSLYKNNTKYFPDYNAALKNGGFDVKTKTFPAKIGEVLEIVWQNVGNNQTGTVEAHPFHAHGDHYWDIGSGSGVYDPIAHEAKLGNRKVMKRDTTNLYRTAVTLKSGDVYSWRAWRIRVRNPGVWMIHCHILQHMVMGMQTVWVFGNSSDLTPLTPAEVSGYLTYGGAAYGNATYFPHAIHYWD